MMKKPYILDQELNIDELKIWRTVFRPSKGTKHDKTVEESLWRRTQSEANKHQSGWQSDADKNRKIVYYRHEYDLIGNKLALIDTYIYFAITMEESKYNGYAKMIRHNLQTYWTPESKDTFSNGDLIAKFVTYDNPKDRKDEEIDFPKGYHTLELKVYFGKRDDTVTQQMIWRIFKAGMRKALSRQNPQYIKDVKEITDLFPAQLALGCGPSSEAGVLPLHTMHEIYSINEPFSKRFIMDADQDTFINNLTSNPEKALQTTGDYYARIIKAKPTEFYNILQDFYDKGILVGPIITNNFDGIHLRFGIPEIFVRTYDEVVVLPNLQFHQDAKTLMVIGCHADRRSIEQRARERGLNIVYVDPEGWWIDEGFKPYPLESPQSEDFIIKLPATAAFREIRRALVQKNHKANR